MSNPLFSLLGGNALPPNMMHLISRFQQFKSSFKGDARQQVQQMLNSGKISQAQYNQAVQMANALQQMMR